MQQHIFDDKAALAEHFGQLLLQMSQEKEKVYIALSGGSTPKAIFDHLAENYQKQLPWERLYFFWGDERCVAPDHADSNYGMTKTHLFDKVPLPADNIFRVKGELEPTKAAEDYEIQIDRSLPQENNLPAFDLMLLGMGDDGHTASIFPHEMALWNSPLLCEVATHPESGQKRVTLTGKVINNARHILFLVTGSNKAEKAQEIIKQSGQWHNYPAARTSADKTTWLLDKDAAALL